VKKLVQTAKFSYLQILSKFVQPHLNLFPVSPAVKLHGAALIPIFSRLAGHNQEASFPSSSSIMVSISTLLLKSPAEASISCLHLAYDFVPGKQKLTGSAFGMLQFGDELGSIRLGSWYETGLDAIFDPSSKGSW